MTVSVTACGSTPVTVKPAASVPAGYKRVGGAAQGISVAVPASWAAVDPTKESTDSAASRLGLSGISASFLAQQMETLKKRHSILVVDVKSGVDNPRHFSRNLNFFCSASGVTDVGAAGVQFLQSGTVIGLQKFAATHIAQQDLDIGGVPGVESSYQLISSEVGTVYESQLEVLPKQNVECVVTLAVGAGESAGNILSTAAATAQFP